MGIKNFFSTLKNESNNLDNNSYIINTTTLKIDELSKIDNVYIDMPSIIYTIIDKYKILFDDLIKEIIYNISNIDNFLNKNIIFKKYIIYFNNSIHIEKTLNNIKTYSNNYNFIIDKIYNELFYIIDNLPSIKKINIFFDGVPYLAKIKNQISKKIGNKIINDIHNDIIEKHLVKKHLDILYQTFKYELNIDSNLFTKIENDIYNILSNKYNNLLIYINDSTLYGESDHKLINHIKKSNIINSKLLILSIDADFIILSSYLYCIDYNILLLKYDQSLINIIYNNYNNNYNIFKIDLYISSIIKKINNYSNILQVLDIIPSIKSLDIKKHYNLIFEKYNENNKQILFYNDKILKINFENLLNFFRILSINEKDRIKNIEKISDTYISKYNLDKINYYDKSENKLDYLFIYEMYKKGYFILSKNKNIKLKNVYKISNDGSLIIDNNNYYLSNYYKYNNINYNKKYLIINYIQGFQYILDLYFNDYTVNNNWFYYFNNSPSLADIIFYFDSLIYINPYENINSLFNKNILQEYKNFNFNNIIVTNKEYHNFIKMQIDNYITNNMIVYDNIPLIYINYYSIFYKYIFLNKNFIFNKNKIK